MDTSPVRLNCTQVNTGKSWSFYLFFNCYKLRCTKTMKKTSIVNLTGMTGRTWKWRLCWKQNLGDIGCVSELKKFAQTKPVFIRRKEWSRTEWAALDKCIFSCLSQCLSMFLSLFVFGLHTFISDLLSRRNVSLTLKICTIGGKLCDLNFKSCEITYIYPLRYFLNSYYIW